MISSTWLKRSSSSSIHQLSIIQRLQIRQISSPPQSPSPSPPLINPAICYTNNQSSFLKWLSGVTIGSSLGLLYYWSTTSTSNPESAFFKKPFLTFADWSTPTTESTVDDCDDDHHQPLLSGFRKLSLPDYTSKLLFGDEFRRKVFFNYEKRIRLRSPPEKVFEYFASFRRPDGELLMTPADLMRAVVPVFPPSESNLVRDGYLRGERSSGDLRCPPSEFFMLFDVNNDGLISFKEYIFFVTLLSIPESSFSVAFKMFDIDNNGEIDKKEFKQVMALMRAHNRQGALHRDGLRIGLKVNGSVENGGLVEYFFGKDGKACLQHDKFVQFMRDLHDEILRLEFAHYDYKLRGTISAKDFGLSMVASADMSHLNRLLDRVDELNNAPHLRDIRITLEEFKHFAELRQKLQPFSLALFSYGKVNGLLTREDFQRAASHNLELRYCGEFSWDGHAEVIKMVCGVSLTDNVVAIIFHVFDANHDGNLSSDEFIRVLHKRERDIAQPVETGIMGFLSCCWNCGNDCSIGRFLS